MKRYAEGQIIVHFKSDVGAETAELLGDRFGLRLVKDERPEEGYVYETTRGKEKETAERFEKKYPEFIEFADRRDILYEQRYKKLQDLEKQVEGLKEGEIGNIKAPTKRQFNTSLETLIKKIREMKE